MIRTLGAIAMLSGLLGGAGVPDGPSRSSPRTSASRLRNAVFQVVPVQTRRVDVVFMGQTALRLRTTDAAGEGETVYAAFDEQGKPSKGIALAPVPRDTRMGQAAVWLRPGMRLHPRDQDPEDDRDAGPG